MRAKVQKSEFGTTPHDVFMTLPPYNISTREDDVQLVGSGTAKVYVPIEV